MIDETEAPVSMTIAAAHEVEDDTNAEHLREWEGDAWYPVLSEVDKQLRALDPQYRIEQIKEKFGRLRYYYDSAIDFGDPVRQQMEDVVDNAERALVELDRRARN